MNGADIVAATGARRAAHARGPRLPVRPDGRRRARRRPGRRDPHRRDHPDDETARRAQRRRSRTAARAAALTTETRTHHGDRWTSSSSRRRFEQFAFTFGGAAPIRRVTPGTVLRLWSEDAFGGALRSVTDLSGEKVDLRFVNPQTGPFYVEGAEPGDTLALHFVDLEPARDWAASAAIPFFGGLTSTDRTVDAAGPAAGHDLDLPSRLARAARCSSRRGTASGASSCRSRRCSARSASRPAGERGPQLARARTGSAATWTPRRCAPAPPATSASTSRARCSRSATGTTARARASRAGPPSRAR